MTFWKHQLHRPTRFLLQKVWWSFLTYFKTLISNLPSICLYHVTFSRYSCSKFGKWTMAKAGVNFLKLSDGVDIYTKMTASKRGFQKCIICRGYLYPFGRFFTIFINCRQIFQVYENREKSPKWIQISPSYYTFLESSLRGGHFGVYIDPIGQF